MFVSKVLEGKLNKHSHKHCVKVVFVVGNSEIVLTGDFFSICFDRKITISFIVNNKKDPFKILESKAATIIINDGISINKEYLVNVLSVKVEKNKDFKITIEAQKK